MNLDLTLHRGGRDKPVAILIHGLGVDKGIWTDPLNTRLFAENISLKIFAAGKPIKQTSKEDKKITIGDIPERIDGLWPALIDEGYNLVTWSQKRPVGHIDIVIAELKEVLSRILEMFPNSPAALIGHSRGGLIARKLMEKEHPAVRALITIATPHSGSSLSTIAGYISPLASLLKKLLPEEEHGTVTRTLKKSTEFLTGEALKELMPGSDFFKELSDSPAKGIEYLSFGGTEPRLATLYKLKQGGEGAEFVPLIEIPDSLINLLPSSLMLEELLPGKGDALVSAKSSVMPWDSEHYDVPANHITIMWNRTVIEKTKEVLRRI
ncbi:MAG: alpha/beta fold hydrolase [Nitrospirae bacterium]|nr:alpha/beta fold hydrolase [Nitrospirota bacterium]